MMLDSEVAAEPIPFGSPVRLTPAGLRSCKPEDMDGVAKRPCQPLSDSYYGTGERVIYQIGGEVLAMIDNKPIWVDLRGGKICLI